VPSGTPGDSRNETTEEVPEGLVTQAKSIFVQRGRGDLAALTLDSLVDGNDSPADHRLRFEHGTQVIDLHVSASGTGSDLTGHSHSPPAIRVELERDGTDLVSHAESVGGVFSFTQVPHGRVRLHLFCLGVRSPVHTDWFLV
jgi:hypothetical protein